jgi:hypothetical protein
MQRYIFHTSTHIKIRRQCKGEHLLTTKPAAAVEIEWRNRQLVEKFMESIKSPKTRERALAYLHKYMRHWLMVDENDVP